MVFLFPSPKKSNNTAPSVLDIVEGLRHISSFDGIHVEDEVVKRRSSVALVLRFPGLATTSQNNNSDTKPEKSLNELLDFILAQNKFDKFGNLSSHQSPSGAASPRHTPVNNSSSEKQGAPHTTIHNKWIPEVLFIKRVNRKGDRWSGHVALPGGKRDPEDESDKATADRETFEEVGIDLNKHAYYVGPLDQRLVRTSWGRITLMTLCPFVYILKEDSTLQSFRDTSEASASFDNTNNTQFLNLQPAEIDRAFWIQVTEMYLPEYANAYESVALGDRLKSHKSSIVPGFLLKMLARTNGLGKMLFGATDLVHPRNMVVSVPIEQTSSTDTNEKAKQTGLEIKETHPELSTMAASADPTVLESTSEEKESLISSIEYVKLDTTTLPQPNITESVTTVDPPYKLWGLTYGIVVDLLESFKPYSATKFFNFPTLTAPDTRLIVWILTYKYVQTQRQKFKHLDTPRKENSADSSSNNEGKGNNSSSLSDLETAWKKATAGSVSTLQPFASRSRLQEGEYDIAGKSLAGYFPFLSKAIVATLIFRSAVLAYVLTKLVKFLLKKRKV